MSDPTLHEGSTGSDVKTLQTLLAKMGADPQGTDGNYGTNTTQAVKNFQNAYGLTPDGVAGPETWAKLRSETSTQPKVTYSEVVTLPPLKIEVKNKQASQNELVANIKNGLEEVGKNKVVAVLAIGAAAGLLWWAFTDTKKAKRRAATKRFYGGLAH